MNLTDDDTLKFQFGVPIFLEDVCAIYPATLREIVEVGYSNFQKYLGLLTTDKPFSFEKMDKELQAAFQKMTGFQYFLSLTFLDPTLISTIQQDFKFFIHEDIIFLMEPPQIIVGPREENHIIDEHNFYDFQRILKRMYFLEQEGEEIIIDEKDDPRVRALKMKMKENREKLKRAKANKAAKEKSDLKFSDLIGSLTLNNCNLNINNIQNLTYYAFHDQLKRMGWRDQFTINHQAALAGAKMKKEQMKHWIRTISNDE